jgi:hypothetical protein
LDGAAFSDTNRAACCDEQPAASAATISAATTPDSRDRRNGAQNARRTPPDRIDTPEPAALLL